MRSDRFNDTELSKVEERFRDHPLFTACQRAFKRYQANMAPLLFAHGEVFYEATIIIDHLHQMPQTDEVKTYIADLWNDLRIKLSKWEKTASPKNLDMAVSSVLYTVAMAMNRHWTTFYYYDVTRWLLQAIMDNMNVDFQEMMRVFGIFLDGGDEIEDWINNIYDGHIGDKIEMVLKDISPFSSAVSNPQKANAVIKRLHELMEGKSKPKDVIMPIRAAIDVGAIRRPTDEEFYNEFGKDRVKGKSSFNDYTNPNKTPYNGADFNAMKEDFSKIIEE